MAAVRRKTHSSPAKKANKTQHKQQAQKQQQTKQADKSQQAKKAETPKNELSDRQRGIRDEINSNKKEDGTSEIQAQQGDKVGDVVKAGLDKDGDGKLSDAENEGKGQYVSDLFASNPSLASKAEAAGLDVNDTSPENVEKLMALGLDPGEKIKTPAEAAAAEDPAAAEEAAEEGKTPEEAAAEEAKAPEEAAKKEGACEGGKPEEGKGEEAKGAEGAKKAEGPQQQKETVEALITKAAQLISQAEAGGQQQTQGTQGNNAQGGDPVQLASQAKQLLAKAKGMVAQQQPQNAQGAQNAFGQQGNNTQNAQNPFGQQGNQNAQNNQITVDPKGINEQSLQQMQPNQKIQVIEALDMKATQIIQGGGQANKQNPMNQLAQMISGNSPMNASNNFAAQNLMKPNLPMFSAA